MPSDAYYKGVGRRDDARAVKVSVDLGGIMQKYKVADLIVGVDFRYRRGYEQAQPYRVDDDASADFCLEPSEEDFEYEMNNGAESREIVEYVLTRWLFQSKILLFDGLVLHSSAVVYEDRAYLFSADSGTGKSTHTQFWIRQFGADKTFILNDDAPAIRKINGVWRAYGTPWSGSSPLNVNANFPLRGIGFIERSSANWTKQLAPDDAAKRLLMQTTSPLRKKTLIQSLDRVVNLLKEVPVFLVGCALDPDSARVSYEAMRDARSYLELDGRL